MTDVPHLAWPLRLSGSSFAAVEQDSIDEVEQNVAVICDTHVGTYIDLPDLGIPDPTFTQAPIDVQAIEDALAEHEPRATARVDVVTDPRILAQGRDPVTVYVALAEAA